MVAKGPTREVVEVCSGVGLVAVLSLLVVALDVLEDALGEVGEVCQGLPPGWFWSIAGGVDEQACATFAQIFPVLLIASVVEQSAVSRKIRLRAWWRTWFVLLPMSVSGVGTLVALWGLMTGGLGLAPAGILFVIAVMAVLALMLQLIAVLASREIADEEAVAADGARKLPISQRVRVLFSGRPDSGSPKR